MADQQNNIRTYPSEGVRRLGCAIFEAVGCGKEEAAIVSNHLVDANLAGHDSHGVKMIPIYLTNIDLQGLFPNIVLQTILDTGTVLAFDGGYGYGQRLAREATDAAIRRCRETGSVIWSLRNSHHIGRVGAYGEQVIEAGLVGLFFVNVAGHDPTVAPYGGCDSRFGTNPICIAVPGGDHGAPLMLDFATSRIAFGKVEVAYNKGVAVPGDCLVDSDGVMTTDPGVMFDEPKGAQLPFGEHKGSGLALMCEILAGALSGGFTIQPEHNRKGPTINNLFSVLIRPDVMPGGSGLPQEVERIVAYVKSATPMLNIDGVLVAGEAETIARTERLKNGMPIDDVTWENILTGAEKVGLSREKATGLVFGGY